MSMQTMANRKQKASVPSRRQVESMPYGSSSQIAAADLWWSRFVSWRQERYERNGDEGYYVCQAWRKILFKDVWYLAQQRRLYANG